MKNLYALTLIFALGAPAAAELAAPQLPLIDAAAVRSQPFEENIDISSAIPVMATAPAGAARAAAAGETVYANERGCSVTVEERNNGYILYVKDGGRQAFLGVLKDYSSGDIGAFCRPAASSLEGSVLKLGCAEQNNGGLPTRGYAELDLRGGLSAVRVRGEVKKTFGWKTDTEIACENLRHL